MGCQVQIQYPQIEINHTTNYQVDHCITRSNHLLTLEPRNGTVVCSACNRAKHYCNKSIGRAIDEIVKKREGEEFFADMVRIDMAKTANPNWCKRWWLAEITEKLTKELEKYGT